MGREQPEFYEIIPEYNAAGRLCNHGSGNEPTVKVPADEWERFNQLAGRQHEIIDGIVVFNENLEPCLPDEVLQQELRAIEARILAILDQQRIDEACGTVVLRTTPMEPIGGDRPIEAPSELDQLIQRRNELKALIEG